MSQRTLERKLCIPMSQFKSFLSGVFFRSSLYPPVFLPMSCTCSRFEIKYFLWCAICAVSLLFIDPPLVPLWHCSLFDMLHFPPPVSPQISNYYDLQPVTPRCSTAEAVYFCNCIIRAGSLSTHSLCAVQYTYILCVMYVFRCVLPARESYLCSLQFTSNIVLSCLQYTDEFATWSFPLAKP